MELFPITYQGTGFGQAPRQTAMSPMDVYGHHNPEPIDPSHTQMAEARVNISIHSQREEPTK